MSARSFATVGERREHPPGNALTAEDTGCARRQNYIVAKRRKFLDESSSVSKVLAQQVAAGRRIDPCGLLKAQRCAKH